MPDDNEAPAPKRFERRKHQWFDDMYLYKDLETREIHEEEDFIWLRLQGEVEITNINEDGTTDTKTFEHRRGKNFTW